MNNHTANSHGAFDLLSGIQDQAIELAEQELSYVSQSAGVKYIAFVVNGYNFYCDSLNVREVSTCGNLMPVPQTKQWMRGLVNSKGTLYSVTDLSLLAGFGRATPLAKGHLLLLDVKQSQTALLVNRIIGFRYFDDSEELPDLDAVKDQLEGLAAFVQKGFSIGDEVWFRLNIQALSDSELFREVQ